MIAATVHPSVLGQVDTAETVSTAMVQVLAVLGAVIGALVVASLIRRAVRISARRWPMLDSLSVRSKWPLRLLLVSVGVWLAIRFTTEPSSWSATVDHGLAIILILAGGWLLVEVTRVVQDGIVARFPTDVPDNRHARRVHTQVQVIGRLAIAIIVLVAGASILFTFPGMRAIGASVLASAGLAAIIAGLAAQSSLANLFAGMQVAFTDSLRVDDVVVVEGEWGRIEEITLTYVVVHIWDDRRLVLPSTYFTSTPFQNWTRKTSQLLGTVDLDVDWTVPMEGLRGEMDRLLSETELWDERVAVIQVTEATGGMVRVRALASAASAPVLWDLRCYLREGLVTWLQQAGSGLPRSRFQTVEGEPSSVLPIREEAAGGARARAESVDRPSDRPPHSADDAGLFTGTYEAVQRSRDFTGPIQGLSGERVKPSERAKEAQRAAGDGESEGFEGWD